MAIIKCHSLKGNIQNAIDYITNIEKTAKGCVGSSGVNIGVAGITWNIKRSKGSSRKKKSSYDDVTGYHFIQSFPPDSITPEEANDIAREWIDRVLNNSHDYVIATHIDKKHIHTHIIVNSMNNKTGKNIDIYYNRDIPIFKKLSDKVCLDHNQKILDNSLNKYDFTYYEWLKKNEGDSYKDIVKKTIDNIIPKVKNFDEFVLYLKALDFEVEVGDSSPIDNPIEDGIFRFSINEKMIDINKETETHHYIRIPLTKKHIFLPKETTSFTSNGKTIFVELNYNDEIDMLDSNSNTISKVNGLHIKNFFDDKGKEKELRGRKGLRIKPPGSTKFIRCNRFNKDSSGNGYSLEDVKERIENNGRYISDPVVEKFIRSSYTKQQTKDNKELYYKDMNFKEGFKNSRFTMMTPEEKFIYTKMKNINSLLNEIRSINTRMSNHISLPDLDKQKKEIISELDKLNKILKAKEIDYQQILQKRMEDILIVTDNELDEYVLRFITPLKDSKVLLLKELKNVETKIKTKQASQNLLR